MSKWWATEVAKDSSPGGSFVHLTIKRTDNAYTYPYYICRSPTSNCQVASIASMQNILAIIRNKYDPNEGVNMTPAGAKDMFKILLEAFALVGHSPVLALLDVKSQYVGDIDKNFSILSKTPYASPNGSSMTMYLVRSADWQTKSA